LAKFIGWCSITLVREMQMTALDASWAGERQNVAGDMGSPPLPAPATQTLVNEVDISNVERKVQAAVIPPMVLLVIISFIDRTNIAFASTSRPWGTLLPCVAAAALPCAEIASAVCLRRRSDERTTRVLSYNVRFRVWFVFCRVCSVPGAFAQEFAACRT